MHIVTLSRLKQFYKEHSNAEPSLRAWYKLAAKTQWNNFAELRQTFASADQVGNLTVFNIGGNNYRLITYIDYKSKKIFIRHVLTHADYDKGHWKHDPWNQ